MKPKKMRYFVIILVIISSITLVSGQQYFCNCNLDSGKGSEIISQENLLGKHFIDMYLNNSLQFYGEWAEGNIIMENGSMVTNKSLRYNGLYDDILWKRKSNNQVASIEKSTIKSVELFDVDGKPYMEFEKVHFKNSSLSDQNEVFLQVLAQGKYTLYALRKVAVMPSNNELYTKFKLYLYKDGEFTLVLPKRFSLLISMKGEKQNMKQVLRENKIKVKGESGLIEAVNLYNKKYQ